MYKKLTEFEFRGEGASARRMTALGCLGGMPPLWSEQGSGGGDRYFVE